MKRREFITALGVAATIFLPFSSAAQQQVRRWRIGVLDTAPRQFNAENMNALMRGLGELGYEEGRNLLIEYRSVEGNNDRLPAVAKELIGSQVDLLAVRGTPEVLAVYQETKTIPIIMLAVVDPVKIGVASSLNHPGKNVTGLSSTVTILETKRLGLIKEISPTFRRLAFIGDLRNPAVQAQWNEIEAAAQTLQLNPAKFEIRSADDIRSVFEIIQNGRFDAIRVGVDGTTRPNRRLIIDLGLKYNLPAMYAAREFADDGGLIAYGANYPALYYRAASFIEKILKGAPPADIPIEEPTKFELVLNLKTARNMGLEIPPRLLAIADEVIE